jgi:hypothetical protein
VSFEMLLRVVIVALAAYRTARMIALEDGPFDVFSRFRSKFDKPKGTPRNWIERGVSCPSMRRVTPQPGNAGLSYLDYVVYGVVWLAVSGLQVALQKQERND